jgi:hypothetical protein
VVPEENPPVHGLEVAPVVEPLGGRRPRVVGLQDPALDESCVEAIGDGVGCKGREEQPPGADFLAPGEGEHAPAHRAHDGNEDPNGVPS